VNAAAAIRAVDQEPRPAVARLLLLLLSLASLAQAEDDLEKLVEALGNGSNGAALVAAKDPRTAALIESALPRFTTAYQPNAIRVLGELPAQHARPVLRRLLTDKSPLLRLCAALALHDTNEGGLIAVMTAALDAPEQSADAYPALVGAFVESKPFGEGGLAMALIRPQRTDAFLLAFFSDRRVRAETAAIEAATLIATEDKRPGPRGVAAAYLVRHKRSQFAAQLGEALRADGMTTDTFRIVRSVFLDARGAHPDKPSEVATNTIAKAARTQKDGDTVAAMLGYLRWAKYPKLTKLCQRLVEHKTDATALAAFRILGDQRLRPSDDALRRIVKDGPDGAAIEAARLLLVVDDRSGFDRVLRYVQAGTAPRAAAIGVLGKFRRPAAVSPLITALNDGTFTIRSAASDALEQTLKTLFPYRAFSLAAADYSPRGNEAKREDAVARIRAWWEKNKNADW